MCQRDGVYMLRLATRTHIIYSATQVHCGNHALPSRLLLEVYLLDCLLQRYNLNGRYTQNTQCLSVQNQQRAMHDLCWHCIVPHTLEALHCVGTIVVTMADVLAVNSTYIGLLQLYAEGIEIVDQACSDAW